MEVSAATGKNIKYVFDKMCSDIMWKKDYKSESISLWEVAKGDKLA